VGGLLSSFWRDHFWTHKCFCYFFILNSFVYNNGRRKEDAVCWYGVYNACGLMSSINRLEGGLDENVNERILSAAFITFGEIKEIQMPVDPGTS